MKSKRLLSLALAVALSLSALGVYATGSGDAGVTVSAKSISYNTDVEVKFPEMVATVTLTGKEVYKLWKDGNMQRFYKGGVDTWGKDSNGDWYKQSELEGNNVTANDTNLMVDPKTKGNTKIQLSKMGLDDEKLNRLLYKTYGWALVKFSNTELAEDDIKDLKGIEVTSDKAGENKAISTWVYLNLSEVDLQDKKDSEDNFLYLYFAPVYKVRTDEEILEDQAAEEAAAAVSKVKSSWTDHAYRAAYRNSAGNNVRNKSSGGIATMFAEAKIQTGEIDTDKNLVYNKEQIASIKKAVGAEDDEIVFVYNVRVPKDYELITGKKMGVRLQLPSGYTTKGYIPTVFHAPITGVQKVENFETGAYEVMFFARDFSPYVLILSPGKVDKYENPPTGDASAVPVALLAAASLSATGTVLLRRKRELGE